MRWRKEVEPEKSRQRPGVRWQRCKGAPFHRRHRFRGAGVRSWPEGHPSTSGVSGSKRLPRHPKCKTVTRGGMTSGSCVWHSSVGEGAGGGW